MKPESILDVWKDFPRMVKASKPKTIRAAFSLAMYVGVGVGITILYPVYRLAVNLEASK